MINYTLAVNMIEGYYRRKTTEQDDFYPTPPWATRALFRYVLKGDYLDQTCVEPACGKGDMSKILRRHFVCVDSLDLVYRGYGQQVDFFDFYDVPTWDWVITNPPFNQAEAFILKSLKVAKVGVAMLCRLQLMEGKRRYNNLFSQHQPEIIAPFVERVSMQKGKVVKNSNSTMAMAWFIWNKEVKYPTIVEWIPPCKDNLEFAIDYWTQE